jgi:site-specific DNA recombinase
MSRPVFDEAVEACVTGEAQGLIVAKLDRFARSLSGALTTIERLERAGAGFISVAENIDTSTPAGKFQQNIFLALAQMERERIAESWESSRRNAVEKRRIHVASKTPTGYLRAEDKTLIPDPATAPAIRDIFRLRAEGNGWSRLRDHLRERGVKSPYGGNWTPQGLKNIVRNRVYLGEARSGAYRCKDAHPALVSQAEWDAAQRARGVVTPARSEGGALLSGIIRCAGCRYVMKPDSIRDRNGNRVDQYRCRNQGAGGDCPSQASVLRHILDPWVVEQLFLAIDANGILARPAEASLRLTDAERNVEEARFEREVFLTSVSAAEFGADAYAAGLRARQERLDEAMSELAAIAGQEDARNRLPEPTTLAEMWPTLSTQRRRSIIAGAFDAVMLRRPEKGSRTHISERAHIITAGNLPSDFPRRGLRTPIRSFAFPE